MIDHRRPFREYAEKPEPNSDFRYRVTLGQAYGADALIVAASTRHERAKDVAHLQQYESNCELTFEPRSNGDVRLRVEVTNYTKNGARRTSSQSIHLPAVFVDAIARAITTDSVREVMATLPGTKIIGEPRND
jgi:hypothetical protein